MLFVGENRHGRISSRATQPLHDTAHSEPPRISVQDLQPNRLKTLQRSFLSSSGDLLERTSRVTAAATDTCSTTVPAFQPYLICLKTLSKVRVSGQIAVDLRVRMRRHDVHIVVLEFPRFPNTARCCLPLKRQMPSHEAGGVPARTAENTFVQRHDANTGVSEQL